MWFLSRPDAKSIWENKYAQKFYTRYKAIIDGKKKARYLLTKKIACKVAFDSPLEDLWSEHRKLAADFKKKLESLDKGEFSLKDLPEPKQSFLDLKEKIALRMLENCHFCERRCEINRRKNELGFCKLGEKSYISSAFLHLGEESVLVPSGTIFFTGCTFNCVFCQNYDISQEWCKDGKTVTEGVHAPPNTIKAFAEDLWRKGAKNINFVGGDPTPNIHSIISALKLFDKNITMLWNSNMYQSLEATTILLELMDFWLPDFKFWQNDFAKEMSGVNNYQEVVSRNIRLAYSAGSGEVLVRHLIMPGRVREDTKNILTWCKKEVPKAMVNLMDQYHPNYLVSRHPRKYSSLNRRLRSSEWIEATEIANSLGVIWEPVS